MAISGWFRTFLLALITLPIVQGFGRNIGSFLKPFEGALQISRADSSLLTGIWFVMVALGLLILGQLNQFIKLNKLLLGGMLTLATGLFMTAYASSYGEILFWFSIVSGLGFGTSFFVCFATSIYDVYERKGLSTGINSAMRVGGTALFLVGLRWLIDKVFGLSGTFIALSIMISIAGIIGYFLASTVKSKTVWFKFNKKLIRYYVSVSLTLGIMSMLITHKLPIFKDAGLSIGALGIIALVGFWIDAGTEPLAGWFFIDKMKNTRIAWIVSVIGIVAVSLLLVALSNGLIGFLSFVILSGIIAILPTPIVPAFNYIADRHKEDYGVIFGTTLFFVNLSSAFFVWIGGIFYSWKGSYELIFCLSSIVAIVCALIIKED